jgi:hypothetical protein
MRLSLARVYEGKIHERSVKTRTPSQTEGMRYPSMTLSDPSPCKGSGFAVAFVAAAFRRA